MSTQNVEKLLLAGGKDKLMRARYNEPENKVEFVALAKTDGYDFTVEELEAVLKEEALDFDSSGNPRTRQIWLR